MDGRWWNMSVTTCKGKLKRGVIVLPFRAENLQWRCNRPLRCPSEWQELPLRVFRIPRRRRYNPLFCCSHAWYNCYYRVSPFPSNGISFSFSPKFCNVMGRDLLEFAPVRVTAVLTTFRGFLSKSSNIYACCFMPIIVILRDAGRAWRTGWQC